MSQTFTDDCYAGGHVAATDLTNMEANFAALKSAFSGATTPANTVAGMWWFDTTANILKLRNEANSAWLSVWDFANNKPILANNVSADFAAALKDPAAGTAGLRTLGTGATQAKPGNAVDAHTGDVTGTTALTIGNGKVTAANLIYTAGNILVHSNDAEKQRLGDGTWHLFKSTRVAKTGILRIKFDGKSAAGDRLYVFKIYKNGSPVGTQRATAGYNVYTTFTEDIAGWVAGDECQIYGYEATVYYGTVRNFRLYTGVVWTESIVTA